jgi:plasmid stability protein
MAQLVIRKLDINVKHNLKKRAVQHGISMEAEARLILTTALKEENSTSLGLGSRIASRFSGKGLEQPLPELHGELISPMKL